MEPYPYLQKIELLQDKIEDRAVYPFNLPIIENFKELTFHKDVTFIIGENGVGKSTLIEAIAIILNLNAEGGSRNHAFSTYASHSSLHQCLRPSRSYKRPRRSFFLRAESFYNVASAVDGYGSQDAYGGRSLHHQSHGESFWSLMMHNFGGQGLYILDEPEAALSPTRQMAALSRVHQLVLQKSQFIIATHSPILLAYPNAQIYEIREGHLCEVEYEQTEHFQVTKNFLNRYEHHLDILLADEE